MEKGTEKNEGLHGTACIKLQEGPKEKDGFKQSREEWKKAEQEYKSIGLENAEEVIDAIMKAKEAAEKAAAHMDKKGASGCLNIPAGHCIRLPSCQSSRMLSL